ncbi:MAG: CDP-diacylglycerol--glycerol-3-phosphate 3-phosphatidyltransferase [Candidatus Omnitrophota bacterium]|jgi:CDP-diacylglycerol--glycerol-3-phosphate 3-phosphatidyltransferase
MNLPNTLTLLRIILTFAFILFLFIGGMQAKIAAMFIFLVASLTDVLDGFFAKRNNQITDFGKLMDPIADKVLVLSAFLAFVQLGIVEGWMVVAVVFREVVITGLRMLALTKGKVIQADGFGKRKTVWQVSVIFLILLFLIFREGGSGVFGFWIGSVEIAYRHAIYALMLITVVFTLSSGISYLVKNREVYSNAKTR